MVTVVYMHVFFFNEMYGKDTSAEIKFDIQMQITLDSETLDPSSEIKAMYYMESESI